MSVDLERMAIFAAVAEAGSFTAAAERLGLAKSAVSQHISQLERELGIQLLQRTTRKVSTTDAGLAFLADCVDLLQRAETAIERARTARGQPSGVLRITSTEDSAALVAHWLAEYRRRYPDVRIDFQPTDRRVDLVGEGFDLALRVGNMPDSSLRATILASFELWVVASKTYLEKHGEPRLPGELAGHEWIALSVVASPWTRHFVGPAGESETVRLHGAISVSTAAGMLHLVRADIGIGSFPDSMVRADIAAGRLCRLLPAYTLPALYLYAAYPGAAAVPAKTRAFIDLARQLGAG